MREVELHLGQQSRTRRKSRSYYFIPVTSWVHPETWQAFEFQSFRTLRDEISRL